MATIQYVQGSSYSSACQMFVQCNTAAIMSGSKLIWRSGWAGGYAGRHLALIISGTTFHATYHLKDPSRFPVRLRALATALRDAGLMQLFFLSHKAGTVTIQRADRPAGNPCAGSSNGISATPSSGIKVDQVTIPDIQVADRWWRELLNGLEAALRGGIAFSKIVFRGGGDIPVPDWFRDWCKKNGVEIEICDPEDFDRRYESECIHVNDNHGEPDAHIRS
jgi:hypothetical protein